LYRDVVCVRIPTILESVELDCQALGDGLRPIGLIARVGHTITNGSACTGAGGWTRILDYESDAFGRSARRVGAMRNLKLEYRSKAGGHRLFGIELSRARDVVGTLCQPQHLPAFDGAIIAGQVGYIAEVICAHSGVLGNAKIKHKRYR